MAQEHTPTPWEVWTAETRDNRAVICTTSRGVFEVVAKCRRVNNDGEADAQLIVRAVNSYAPLVEALTRARDHVICAGIKQRDHGEALAQITAALNLARGEL